jgi:D-alanyl-D-alanine carboxypeptidase (penicillin-binding protein 5/6)
MAATRRESCFTPPWSRTPPVAIRVLRPSGSVFAVLLARRIAAACCLVTLVTASGAAVSGAAAAQAEVGQPAAWILVDGATGEVLDGANIHAPRAPAGAATLLTAMVAVQRLPVSDPDNVNPVLISRDAARAPQPRLGLSQGSAWDVQRLLNAILLTDSHDAAWALAETGAGNLAAFAGEMNALGTRLGLRDSTWTDPTGDDDNTETPNQTSAWDLAVVARAALRVPELSSIVRDPEETINGPQLGKLVENDNDLVQRYDGATGLREAFSDKAGSVLVGAAERDGRSLIVVVLGTDGDPVSFAIDKLDAEFAAGDPRGREKPAAVADAEPVRPPRFATAQARLEALVNLPAVLGRPALATGAIGSQAPPTPSTTAPPTTQSVAPEDGGGGGGGLLTFTNVLIFLLFAGLLTVVVLRRRAIVMRQRKRVLRQRTLNEAKRRGSIDFVDPDQVAGSSHVRILRPEDRDERSR